MSNKNKNKKLVALPLSEDYQENGIKYDPSQTAFKKVAPTYNPLKNQKEK